MNFRDELEEKCKDKLIAGCIIHCLDNIPRILFLIEGKSAFRQAIARYDGFLEEVMRLNNLPSVDVHSVEDPGDGLLILTAVIGQGASLSLNIVEVIDNEHNPEKFIA